LGDFSTKTAQEKNAMSLDLPEPGFACLFFMIALSYCYMC